MVLPLLNKVNMYFTITSLISGYWHGVEDKEAPSEQSICIGVSQIRTLKVDSSPHKGQPFEMCGPVLRDILHFPEHQETHLGQKPYTCGNRFYISATKNIAPLHSPCPCGGIVCLYPQRTDV